jgi:hypothetical protein
VCRWPVYNQQWIHSHSHHCLHLSTKTIVPVLWVLHHCRLFVPCLCLLVPSLVYKPELSLFNCAIDPDLFNQQTFNWIMKQFCGNLTQIDDFSTLKFAFLKIEFIRGPCILLLPVYGTRQTNLYNINNVFTVWLNFIIWDVKNKHWYKFNLLRKCKYRMRLLSIILSWFYRYIHGTGLFLLSSFTIQSFIKRIYCVIGSPTPISYWLIQQGCHIFLPMAMSRAQNLNYITIIIHCYPSILKYTMTPSLIERAYKWLSITWLGSGRTFGSHWTGVSLLRITCKEPPILHVQITQRIMTWSKWGGRIGGFVAFSI